VSEPAFVAEVREFYDALAVDYQHLMGTDLTDRPVERSVLGLFAELVGPGGDVLDAGCGPGRVTAHLASLGLRACGLDLSPVMVEIARAAFPGLSFGVGSLTALDHPDESLDGLLVWYSLIHIAPEARPAVLAECRRVLKPGGYLLAAFQIGDEARDIPAPDGRRYGDGRPVALDFHRLSPDALWAQLQDVRFVRVSSTVRPPGGERESTEQALLIARRD
jgi:ubiquinone/menaquinone biosynthesis C-methylase UbiE